VTTDFQRGRSVLGARLRELRTDAGDRSGLADRCCWAKSKISKLENGKQTPTINDLELWAKGVGNEAAASELRGRLRASHRSAGYTRSPETSTGFP
jgi:transcriptional regulator with XRE-family HTH domain